MDLTTILIIIAAVFVGIPILILACKIAIVAVGIILGIALGLGLIGACIYGILLFFGFI